MENNTKMKLSTPAAIVVAGFLIMVGIIVTKLPAQNEKLIEDNKNAVVNDIAIVPISESDHILGSLETAEAVIIEFSDTECPWCKRFHPALKEVVEKYDGKVAWIYRHSPIDNLHPKARNEAIATECVNQIKGNDIFWQYLDMIYTNTQGNDSLDPNLLVTYAEKFGITPSEFNKCMVDNKINFNKLINASIADGKNAGLEGTPHSVIITKDGKKYPIRGADVDKLNATLESLLK
jgi:protein-disulfide isomerase